MTSSIVGVAGLLWAGLTVTGALRRAVDAVWGADDVGWTARLRSAPWAIIAGLLVALSVAATGIAASVTGIGAALVAVVAVVAVVFTAALSAWFLARLGSRAPSTSALVASTILLTVGFEAVKNGAVFVVPRLVSRDSALYGSLGSALAAIVGLLVISWLLLAATAIAAELTELSATEETHDTQFRR